MVRFSDPYCINYYNRYRASDSGVLETVLSCDVTLRDDACPQILGLLMFSSLMFSIISWYLSSNHDTSVSTHYMLMYANPVIWVVRYQG